ncbi:hypothetical protein NDN08_005573 [Rhodosorus marinus]|uniref:Uncharacterized protein n=1 Tax=Rhodosorus marinus TaxID=101924 RepID=A0AAV8V1Z9_9RHOD|nr:hypothetical protein NDN08_005573 [Rhodosorus marinus]
MDKSLQTIRSGGAEVVGLFERVMSNKKLCAFMKGHAAGMRRVQEELGRSSAGEVLELQKSGRLEPSDHDYGNLLDPKDSAKGDLRIPRETNAAADLVKFLSQTTARASSHTEMSQNPWRGGNFNTAPMTFRHQTSSRPNGHNQVRRAYTWTNSYQNAAPSSRTRKSRSPVKKRKRASEVKKEKRLRSQLIKRSPRKQVYRRKLCATTWNV